MDLRPFSRPSSPRRGAALLSLSLAVLIGSALIIPDAHANADKAAASARKKAASGKKAPAKARAAGKGAAAAAAAAPLVLEAADARQMYAASQVNEGVSLCEFNQQVMLAASQKHPGYIDLSFRKQQWLMKPVISSTGALRLEDVRAETLFIQIRNKSMLMNQKTGQRLVDGCVHPKQQAMSN